MSAGRALDLADGGCLSDNDVSEDVEDATRVSSCLCQELEELTAVLPGGIADMAPFKDVVAEKEPWRCSERAGRGGVVIEKEIDGSALEL